jgi:hypothetical protein
MTPKPATRPVDRAAVRATPTPIAATGTFTRYPALVEALPPIVKRQRRLAARIATVAQDVIAEKAARAEIDALLVAAGLLKGDVVTCAGYDVKHHEKAGHASLNPETIVAELVAAGVDRDLVLQVLVASTETGQPSVYATVTPSKGAKVQKPETLRLAKAGPHRTR